ncbi:putative phospholipid transporting ATPase-like protein [Trypanosoma cruzi]|uniref:Putative phospholipid transporting ATPase-like protein n=1 Tax=Trypanosoma cruzi TaxID=5693 RepID=A0A2V2UKN1_TRYCR|nr:putative phospholipid transporting ATPase-like protein [Trypanosoma cruzi]
MALRWCIGWTCAIFCYFYTVAKWDELYPYRSASLEDYGTLFFMMVLLLLNLRIAAVMTCYTAISVSVIAFGFIAIPTLMMVYSAVPHILGSNWGVNIAMELMGTNKFWMLMFFSVGVFVVYGMAVNTYIALFWPWAKRWGCHASSVALTVSAGVQAAHETTWLRGKRTKERRGRYCWEDAMEEGG